MDSSAQPSQRLKKVAIACPLLEQLLKGGWSADGIRISDGVPEDAKLVGAFTGEPDHRTGYLVFEHESFEEVPIGQQLPTLVPWLYRSEPIVDRALRILNEAFAADPEAMQELVDHRVSCNKKLAEHPTVQVGEAWDARMERYYSVVGLLGILSAIFVHDGPSAAGAIAGMFDTETGKLTGFCRYEPPRVQLSPEGQKEVVEALRDVQEKP